MDENIFRKKSIDRVSSPEELNDYIKVATPSVWIVLSTVALVLIAIFAWALIGVIDTVIKTAAVVKDGQSVIYVSEKNISEIKDNIEISVGDVLFSVESVSTVPVIVNADIDDYVRFLGGFSDGDWIYPINVKSSVPLDDGVYEVTIITDRISPISFITN